MGYNVPTGTLPYAALWAASYVDPTLANVLPNIGVKALTDVERDYSISTSKATRHFGMRYTAVEQTVIDMCHSVVRLGLVPAAPGYASPTLLSGERIATPFGIGTVLAYRAPPPLAARPDSGAAGAAEAAPGADTAAPPSSCAVGRGGGVWEVELDWTLAAQQPAVIYIASESSVFPTADPFAASEDCAAYRQALDLGAGLTAGAGGDSAGEDDERSGAHRPRVRFEVFDARWHEEGLLEAGYALFLIRVRRGAHEWSVEKRYSEIAQLHERLEQAFPGHVLPRMPPTRLIGNASASLMNERRVAFEFANASRCPGTTVPWDDECPTPCRRKELAKYLSAMPTRDRPLLLWDAEKALGFFKKEVWQKYQFPASCDIGNVLLVRAFNWGLLSVVRDFQDLLMAGMYYRRTVVLDLPTYETLASTPELAFLGCTRPYLECFYAPFSSCTYNATVRDKGLTGGEKGTAVSKHGARRWPFTAWVIPNTGKFFPEWIWTGLIERGLVRLHVGGKVRKASPTMFEGLRDDLVASMKTSMLRSLLAATAFQPLPLTEKMAGEMLASQQPFELPMVAIHVRRTDKAGEDPFYRRAGKFLPTKYFFKVARVLEDAEDITFKSVFVLTDTPALFKQLVESGEAGREMRGKPKLLHSNWFEKQRANNGVAHTYAYQFQNGHTGVPATVKHTYQLNFLAEVAAAARHADSGGRASGSPIL
eukprot:g4734.t1